MIHWFFSFDVLASPEKVKVVKSFFDQRQRLPDGWVHSEIMPAHDDSIYSREFIPSNSTRPRVLPSLTLPPSFYINRHFRISSFDRPYMINTESKFLKEKQYPPGFDPVTLAEERRIEIAKFNINRQKLLLKGETIDDPVWPPLEDHGLTAESVGWLEVTDDYGDEFFFYFNPMTLQISTRLPDVHGDIMKKKRRAAEKAARLASRQKAKSSTKYDDDENDDDNSDDEETALALIHSDDKNIGSVVEASQAIVSSGGNARMLTAVLIPRPPPGSRIEMSKVEPTLNAIAPSSSAAFPRRPISSPGESSVKSEYDEAIIPVSLTKSQMSPSRKISSTQIASSHSKLARDNSRDDHRISVDNNAGGAIVPYVNHDDVNDSDRPIMVNYFLSRRADDKEKEKSSGGGGGVAWKSNWFKEAKSGDGGSEDFSKPKAKRMTVLDLAGTADVSLAQLDSLYKGDTESRFRFAKDNPDFRQLVGDERVDVFAKKTKSRVNITVQKNKENDDDLQLTKSQVINALAKERNAGQDKMMLMMMMAEKYNDDDEELLDRHDDDDEGINDHVYSFISRTVVDRFISYLHFGYFWLRDITGFDLVKALVDRKVGVAVENPFIAKLYPVSKKFNWTRWTSPYFLWLGFFDMNNGIVTSLVGSRDVMPNCFTRFVSDKRRVFFQVFLWCL
jgi:hypothetical protein